MLTYQDFEKIEMRVWTIIEVKDFPKARNPSLKVWADFWEFWIKKTSAQITHFYEKEHLIWKQIIWVINFPSKQIADFTSEFLLLWAVWEDKKVTLIKPDFEVKNGERIL